jgi:hypothetical protein
LILDSAIANNELQQVTIDPLIHPQVADVGSLAFSHHQTYAPNGIEACSEVSPLVHLIKPVDIFY